MRRAVAIAVLAGCFGGGPIPLPPSEATVLFGIPDAGDCAQIGYVGDFAIQNDQMLVVVAPDAVICNGQPGQATIDQLAIGSAASPVTTVPSQGVQRVAWAGDVPFIAYAPQNGNTASYQLGDGTGSNTFQITIPPNGGAPPNIPVGLVDDGSGLWMVTVAINDGGTQGAAFDDSEYPNTSAFSNTSQGDGGLLHIDYAGLQSLAIQTDFGWQYAAMPDCLAQNSTDLFGATQDRVGSTGPTPTVTSIVQTPKGSGAGTFSVVATIPNQGNSVGVVGIAADDQRVVWTVSTDPRALGGSCQVFQHDLSGSGSAADMLLSSDRFQCAGAATDGSDVYFAIVQSNDIGTGSGGNVNVELRGLGIGRVSLDGNMTYASIATQITGTPYGGPRRVYIGSDGVSILAGDPHGIGQIQKSAFDGRDDLPR
jgi:hypothetical protein